MARLDRIKTSLFGGMLWQKRGTARILQLNLVAGCWVWRNEERDVKSSTESLTSIISTAKFAGWVLTKTESGEIYRVIADRIIFCATGFI